MSLISTLPNIATRYRKDQIKSRKNYINFARQWGQRRYSALGSGNGLWQFGHTRTDTCWSFGRYLKSKLVGVAGPFTVKKSDWDAMLFARSPAVYSRK